MIVSVMSEWTSCWLRVSIKITYNYVFIHHSLDKSTSVLLHNCDNSWGVFHSGSRWLVSFHWWEQRLHTDTLIQWNLQPPPPCSSQGRCASLLHSLPTSRMLHWKSCTHLSEQHIQQSKLKRIKAQWCSTTAVQIARETTNCYVRSHLLWSKIRLHYSTFPPSLLPYVKAAFCGMGLFSL